MSNLDAFKDALEKRYEEVRTLIAKIDAGVVDPKTVGYTKELIKTEMIILNEYRHIMDVHKELLAVSEKVEDSDKSTK